MQMTESEKVKDLLKTALITPHFIVQSPMRDCWRDVGLSASTDV